MAVTSMGESTPVSVLIRFLADLTGYESYLAPLTGHALAAHQHKCAEQGFVPSCAHLTSQHKCVGEVCVLHETLCGV